MKLNLDKSQVIALLLIFALLINAAIHFSHPSYRFYRQNISRLDSEFKAFRDRVQNDFVPALMFVATNLTSTAVAVSSELLPTAESADTVLPDKKVKPVEPKEVDCFFFVVGGRRAIYYQGFPFFVGDSFRGGEIVSIDASSFRTVDGLFLIRDNRRSFADDRKVVQL